MSATIKIHNLRLVEDHREFPLTVLIKRMWKLIKRLRGGQARWAWKHGHNS